MGAADVSGLSFEILAPALVAGLLILAVHVPLGAIVFNRGGVFVGIALAQAAVLGIAVGNVMLGEAAGWMVQGTAIAAAVGCAMLLAWTEKRFQDAQQAIAGVAYIVMASAQIALLSSGSARLENLKDLLLGQILWASPTQLLVLGAVVAGAMAVWYVRDLANERLLFYGVLAAVIAASVQIAGVFLVFASLVVPVLATRHAPPRWRLIIAFNLGVVGFVLGLVAAAVLDISAGASVVGALAVLAVLAARLIAGGSQVAVPADQQDIKALHDEIRTRLNTTKAA
jgi:zinc/manganese transport system permease protein